MLKLKEKYTDARARVKPEKLAISTGIAGLSIFTILPLQSVLTYILHEVGKEIPTESLRMLAVATIGLANAASIAVETTTLNQKEYSSSPVVTTVRMLSGNSLGVSIGGHILRFMQAYGVNPVHAFNIAAAASGDGGRLFLENATAVTLSLVIWNISCNALILQDSAEKLLSKFRARK